MTKFLTTTSALTLALLFSASAGHAQETNLEDLDVNGDGQLSFEEVDTDDDGEVDDGEMEHAFGEAATRALLKFDADGDGVVTLQEVREGNNAGGNSEAAKARRDEREDKSNRGGNGRGNGGGNGGGKDRD